MRAFLIGFLFLLSFAQHVMASEAEPMMDPKIEDRFKALTSELRCLKCQNQTIYDSKAGLADDLRHQIRDQMEAGKTDDQIVAYLVARYGDFVRYKPAFDGKNMLLWLGPFLFMIIGITVLIIQLRKRRALISDEPLSAEEEKELQTLIHKSGGDR